MENGVFITPSIQPSNTPVSRKAEYRQQNLLRDKHLQALLPERYWGPPLDFGLPDIPPSSHMRRMGLATKMEE